MRVLSLPKSEVAKALRSSNHSYADRGADFIDDLHQDTLGAAIYHNQLENRSLKKRKHFSMAAGAAIMAGAAVDFTLNQGSVGALHTLLRLGGVFLGAGLIVRGGLTGDKVDANEREGETLAYWAKELAPQLADSKSQAQLIQAVANDDGAFDKQRLVGLLEKAEEALGREPDRPGLEGARQQVQEDLRVLRKAPGQTLSEVRELSRQRLKTRGRVTQGLTYAALACGPGTIGLAAIGLGAVGIGGLGGFATAAVMVDELHDEGTLNHTLDRWEMQLESARQTADKLIGKPDLGEVEFAENSIDINGISVELN